MSKRTLRTYDKEFKLNSGSPRIQAPLVIQGELCSRKRIARLMKIEGIQAKMKRRFRVTTQVALLAKKVP